MTLITTCQICARPIKSAKGTIAHHGYKRPGQGWQTASCFGTHYRPYEVACDRIQAAIDAAQDFKTRREHALETLTTNPADTIIAYRRAGTYAKPVQFEVTKPEGFDPANPRRDYRPYSYTTEWDRLVHAARADIREVNEQIAFLQKRLADWKAPA